MDHQIDLVVELPGEHPRHTHGSSSDEVVDTLRRLEGVRDVTMTISPEGSGERLMAAVDGRSVLLGLERPDGLFQFALPHRQEGVTRPFTVGGQESDIEAKYLVDVPTASAVIREWLDGDITSSHGSWISQ